MSSVKMTVRNKDRLYAKLKRLAPEADMALTKANGAAAEEMVRLAQSYVPVRTGRLRASIVATPPGGTPPAHGQGVSIVPPGAFMVTAGNSGVRYPHLVEFGTRAHVAGGEFAGAKHPGTPAQPFFFPAYRLIRRKQKGRATRAINQAVKKVATS